jgi:hypothetical protein
MHSEKLLDMLFTNGKLTRVANQFGNGSRRRPPRPISLKCTLPAPCTIVLSGGLKPAETMVEDYPA